MKHRTLQFKSFNSDGSTVGHAMRFPLSDVYKAFYRVLRNRKAIFEERVYAWEEKRINKKPTKRLPERRLADRLVLRVQAREKRLIRDRKAAERYGEWINNQK